MSIDLLNKAFKTKYQPTTKILLIALADYANEDGSAFPSYKTLMDKTSIRSRDTISTHLQILENDGIIIREQRYNDSNFYRVFPSESEIRTSPSLQTLTTKILKGKSTNRFTPPTEDEIKEYCEEKKYHYSYAEGFIDFYASKGWRVGKNKMVSWKSALSGWIKRSGGEQNGKKELIFA